MHQIEAHEKKTKTDLYRFVTIAVFIRFNRRQPW